MDDRPIGVFDSGFGGLTVARAMIDLLPGEDVVYVGDTGRYPYGPRPLEEHRPTPVAIHCATIVASSHRLTADCRTVNSSVVPSGSSSGP